MSQSSNNNSDVWTLPYYHESLSRSEAEDKLKYLTPGCFLLRESNSLPGSYVLSVKLANKVEHFQINKSNSQYWLASLGEASFKVPTLRHLVEHCQKNPTILEQSLENPVFRNNPDNITPRLHCDVEPNHQDVSTRFGMFHNNCGSDSKPVAPCRVNKHKGKVHQIKPSEVKLGERIGSGEFAEVKKGTYKNKTVAVKIATKKSFVDFEQEIRFLVQCQTVNVINLEGTIVDESSNMYWIVLEFMPNGNLLRYLQSRGRLSITQLELIRFSRDVCCGMRKLETEKIVHRDLAARNILLGNKMVAKISDFGMACCAGETPPKSTIPLKWVAPETIKVEQPKYTSKTDMWSFGILLWEIFSFGRVPYPRIPTEQVHERLMSGYRMEIPQDCPEDIYAIMTEAWSSNPNKRPTFKDTLNKLVDITSTDV